VPYCRRHAGVVRALAAQPDELRLLPDVANRAASLCEWIANDLGSGVRAILKVAMGFQSGWALSESGLTSVIEGTPRSMSWNRGWMLSDHTGKQMRVSIWVNETRDSEVSVRVDSAEVANFIPPWIADRRTKSRGDVSLEREQREYLRSSVLEAVAAATTRGESFAEMGRVVERLAFSEERFKESEERSRAVLENVADGIITLGENGLIESLNPAARRILGYNGDELVGRAIRDLVVPVDPVHAAMDLDQWASRTDPMEITALHKDGGFFPMDFGISVMQLGPRRLFIATFRDISERKAQTEAIEYQALHDALTGLPNRTLFSDRLQQALLAVQRTQQGLAIMLIDLDRFKDVNDTLGHEHGDALLQEIAARLRSALRESDTVARLGGDEFAILPSGWLEGGALEATAEKVLEALRQPIELLGNTVDVDASIGVARYPEDGDEVNVLLRRADVAMYQAKRTRTGYALYSPEQDFHSASRLALVGELRLGITREELLLQYQPKVDCKTEALAGVEALVRWTHPRDGVLGPDRFIPAAEESGLIWPLTAWVLNQALRQVRRWTDAGQDIGVAINVSPRNLQVAALEQTLDELIRAWQVDPAKLTLEITESMAMAPGAHDAIARLRALGVNLAIDDFGTGYSSLAHLKTLPVQEIKIDQSFVKDLANNVDDAAIVRSTIDLGHHLGLKVVAEGVIDANSMWMLERYGCDVAQGNYISEPLTGDEVVRWLADRALSPRAGSAV
jgi:diguanylate cyclase (GGDEF)-like protein/PAS domain S-box-containing protein